ncbi:hypothetical protein F6X86_02060 [Enterococcus durans]|uniref:Uncharacterized protein n=1 Tax=Enterococcus durans TaxID=53345 RepID=A0A5N0Z252_9ENTE|nr:hypothetical protein F6X86_02060 [Enterococcus durans]TKN18032.1 hypothetical protein DVW83_06775 [Enterococcus sp. VV15]KAA9187817.1 hypothetical protein F6X90_02800 [Enterococcus durans]KAA9188140.1 hypothetical protein F6X85_02895 [Enterococcus durans]KAA9190819.1 hypothetical protein F6X88_12235 [Enterococcus durans]
MEKKRAGQKSLTPRNKKKLTEITFQIFVDFGLFPKELLLLPRSFFEIYEKPDFWTPFIRSL